MSFGESLRGLTTDQVTEAWNSFAEKVAAPDGTSPEEVSERYPAIVELMLIVEHRVLRHVSTSRELKMVHETLGMVMGTLFEIAEIEDMHAQFPPSPQA